MSIELIVLGHTQEVCLAFWTQPLSLDKSILSFDIVKIPNVHEHVHVDTWEKNKTNLFKKTHNFSLYTVWLTFREGFKHDTVKYGFGPQTPTPADKQN